MPDAHRPWLAHYPEGIDWHARFHPRPFHAVLEDAAARYADRPCIDFLDRQTTYREVHDMTAKVARGLMDLGVGKGTKVGLFLPNCPYSVICFFAILKAGGTVVNYNPLYVAREIEQQVVDSETEIMITLDLKLLLPKLEPLVDKGLLKAVVVARLADCLPFPKNYLYPWVKRDDIAKVPNQPAFLGFDRLIAGGGDIAPVPIDPERDIALIQYTGGTTGIPKGAVHTHASLVINAEQLAAWTHEFEAGGERVLGVIPLFHVLAISTVLTFGIRTGAMLILLPRFDLDQVLQTIHKKRPTFLPGVPTLFNAISGHPEIDRFDLTSIKFCISGGAPLPIEVKETFERRAGCSLVEGYGLTEAPVTHCNPFHGLQKQGSFGLPMPGTTIEILSLEDGTTILPPGARGEVCISGPQVMKGYWRRPEETANALRSGRLHTGDIGYLDQDGYGFIVDRLKDLIICSGFNVYPRVVEEALYDHPAVLEAAVCGMPDAYRGETVKAYVVRREGAVLDEAGLLAFLKDRLSPIEMPKIVEFRAGLPKSAVGKILKKELLREERERAGAP
ncbi:MAG: long-chain fatty acid--CoA ligase [Rhizobiales bacterium]|nr:long-chain fatty acid--CoA ligase [Hyphomicrobiales bacterium]